jgi:hypothetical protein
MNPASNGMTIAGIVILSIIVVILALALIKAHYPNSATAKAVGEVERFAQSAESVVEHVVDPLIFKAEIGVGNELVALLSRIEQQLTSTAAEDALIAEAQQYLERVTAEVQTKINAANSAKQAKIAATQAHVATLTAAIPGPTV